MKLGILTSFANIQKLVDQYCEACKELGVEYVLLDLLDHDWISKIRDAKVDGILVRVYGTLQEYKSLFDERLYIINEEMKIPVYPSRKELYLYENKRLCEYWMTLHGYPHAKTKIFYRKDEAKEFVKKADYPLVFKTNGGATASGVQIVRSKAQARRYVRQIFGAFDYRLSFGKVPWKKGGIPVPKFGMAQKHYAIIQEFIPIKWEWRIIKIGNSYFGHKKLLKGDFASGSGLYSWDEPPVELYYLIKDVCEKGNFNSIALDIFEGTNDKYYINEIQSLFGSYAPYQVKKDGKPGRYYFENGEFKFEEGEFNRLGSNLLRVKDFVQILEKMKQ